MGVVNKKNYLKVSYKDIWTINLQIHKTFQMFNELDHYPVEIMVPAGMQFACVPYMCSQ